MNEEAPSGSVPEPLLKAFEFAQDSTKQVIALSTGILALTITFLTDVAGETSDDARLMLYLAWVCYLLAVITGIAVLLNLSGNLEKAAPPSIYRSGIRVFSVIQLVLFAAGLSLTLAFGVIAVTSPPPTESRTATEVIDAQPTLPPAYLAAVADAQNPEPHEISTTLTAITSDNPALAWRNVDGRAHVLVAKVAPDAVPYEDRLGQAYSHGDREMWVTVAPDLAKACSEPDFAGDGLAMRIRQLLGLPPGPDAPAVVELWVEPSAMFRPAPDPEIDDQTAGLQVPDDVHSWYRRWFNDLRARSYQQGHLPPVVPYPWTQLGYTYDWGDGGTEVGLSEFVVQPRTDMIVELVTTLEDYCQPELATS